MRPLSCVAIVLLAAAGCEDRRRGMRPLRSPAGLHAKIAARAKATIDRAREDPEVSEDELEIIIILENARKSVEMTEATLASGPLEDIRERLGIDRSIDADLSAV